MKKGFSLIELMIVVAIIGILAMIAVPMYQRYIEKAQDSATQSALQYFSLAVIAFNVDAQRYPTSAELIYLPQYGYMPDRNVVLDDYAVTTSTTGPANFHVLGAHRSSTKIFVYDSSFGGVREVSITTGIIK